MSKGFYLFPAGIFWFWELAEDLAYQSEPGLGKRETSKTFRDSLQDWYDKLKTWRISNVQLLFLTEHLLSSAATQKSKEIGQKLPERKVKSPEGLRKWPNSKILLVLPSRNLPYFEVMKVGDWRAGLRCLKGIAKFLVVFQTWGERYTRLRIKNLCWWRRKHSKHELG